MIVLVVLSDQMFNYARQKKMKVTCMIFKWNKLIKMEHNHSICADYDIT